jgi:hypothetical protein
VHHWKANTFKKNNLENIVLQIPIEYRIPLIDRKVNPDLWIDYYKNSLKFSGKFCTFPCLAKLFTDNPFLDQLLYTVALEGPRNNNFRECARSRISFWIYPDCNTHWSIRSCPLSNFCLKYSYSWHKSQHQTQTHTRTHIKSVINCIQIRN